MPSPRDADSAIDSINELIALLREGVDLHEKAMHETSDIRVKQLSQGMIAERRRVIEELKPFVMQGGHEPAARGTMAGDARAIRAKLKALVGDRDTAYVRELEKMESRTVATIDACILACSDRQVVSRLKERKDPFSRAAEELHKLGRDA